MFIFCLISVEVTERNVTHINHCHYRCHCHCLDLILKASDHTTAHPKCMLASPDKLPIAPARDGMEIHVVFARVCGDVPD